MSQPNWQSLADKSLAGELLTRDEARAVLNAPDSELLDQLAAAYRVRRATWGNRVRLHFLLNAQSGLCSEDCGYCSQSKISAAEIEKVEDIAYDFVLQNSAVTTRVMGLDDARTSGARALFGEKYGDEVRVVSMGPALAGSTASGWSVELCGGTHVARTGEVGLVRIARTERRGANTRVEFLCAGRALARPRCVAVWFETLAQAQSMAPCAAATGVALFTFGDKTMVWPLMLPPAWYLSS